MVPLSSYLLYFCLYSPSVIFCEKSFFFLKAMLFNAVLSADYKYVIYLIQKPTFIGHSLKIWAHFMDFSALYPVFPRFEHFLHFFSYCWICILKEHGKLHRSLYITRWIKVSLLAYRGLRGSKIWFLPVFDSKVN